MLKHGFSRNLLFFLSDTADGVMDLATKRTIGDFLYGKSYNVFSKRISQILTVGDIEKIEKKGEIYYRLTSQGSQKVHEDIPILRLAQKKWDKKWRIVIFDVQEVNHTHRDTLREKLLLLGFGRWQKSVYIAPFNVKKEIDEYLKNNNFFPAAVCLEASQTSSKDDKVLAETVWRLYELNEEYANFISDCEMLTETSKIKKEEVHNLWLEYTELALKDPHLPHELLPDNWLRDNAKQAIIRIVKKINKNRKHFHFNENEMPFSDL